MPNEISLVEEWGEPTMPLRVFSAESEIVEEAAPRRKAEFLSARACAQQALVLQGLGGEPILQHIDGSPRWPPDVIGSITHTKGYRSAAIGKKGSVEGVGIDAEPLEQLPLSISRRFFSLREQASIQNLTLLGHGRFPWSRLYFCIKECVFKAARMHWRTPLEIEVHSVDRKSNTFNVYRSHSLGGQNPASGETLLQGQWAVDGRNIFTSCVIYEGPFRRRSSASETPLRDGGIPRNSDCKQEAEGRQ